jgi:hypothetical protein
LSAGTATKLHDTKKFSSIQATTIGEHFPVKTPRETVDAPWLFPQLLRPVNGRGDYSKNWAQKSANFSTPCTRRGALFPGATELSPEALQNKKTPLPTGEGHG